MLNLTFILRYNGDCSDLKLHAISRRRAKDFANNRCGILDPRIHERIGIHNHDRYSKDHVGEVISDTYWTSVSRRYDRRCMEVRVMSELGA